MDHRRTLEATVRALAAARGGVFTSEDVRRAGCSRGRARTLVAHGDWVVLRRRVYTDRALVELCAPDPQARHALATAAALAATSRSRLAAGPSAAAVHGLETVGAGHEPVTLLSRRPDPGTGASNHGFRAGVGRTLVSHVPPEDATTSAGLACTTVARTAVDLARSFGLRAGVVALDSAARQFGTTSEDLRQVAGLQVGWPYARRTAVALDLMDERSESVLETLGRLSLRHTSLPAPVSQVWVGEWGPEIRVDFLIRELRIVGEGDGRLKYTDPRVLWEEKRRQDRLEDLGYRVVRFDWDGAWARPRQLADRFVVAAARPVLVGTAGLGREFPDPAWWLAQRRAAWQRAGSPSTPWWLRSWLA